MSTRHVCSVAIVMSIALSCLAQSNSDRTSTDAIPTSTQMLLDAAGTAQRSAIRSVMLIYCLQTKTKGTGFLLRNGLVITNAHVVSGCEFNELEAHRFDGSKSFFSGIQTDDKRDLAALKPMIPLSGGFELSDFESPDPGMTVSTWGYPLVFSGPAPLLAVGYVSGFSVDNGVKHIVVNGAFNPGNSGGPLFVAQDNRVIGVVVAKHHLFPPYVKNTIDGLSKTDFGVMYKGKDERGREVERSEAQVIAQVLDEFYQKTQVVIGEAISVSELKAFLKEKGVKLK